MFIVVGAVLAGAIFVVAAYTLGRADGMSHPTPDAAPLALPTDRLCSAADLGDLRFDTGLRGYRMGQVDAVLRRLAYDLDQRDERIRELTARLEPAADADDSEWSAGLSREHPDDVSEDAAETPR